MEDIEQIEASFRRMVKQDDSFNVDNYCYCNWIIVCLTSSLFIPPHRLMDWFNFKIQIVDKSKNNYLQPFYKSLFLLKLGCGEGRVVGDCAR